MRNVLKDAAYANITIEGHCDLRGSDLYDLALGEKRARTLKAYLVSPGVSNSRITIVSYFNENQLVTGRDNSAWKLGQHARFRIAHRLKKQQDAK